MAMNDDDDDDSHTTLNRQGGDDDSCATSIDLLAPSPQKENDAVNSISSSPAPSISPSTQTLNVLSQHDAVGGGNLQYDMRNLNQDASDVTDAAADSQQQDEEMTASQQVQVSARNNFEGWKLFPVALTEPGSLGMTVRRLPREEDPSQEYVIVVRVIENSQAKRAGILQGDVVAAKYEEVTKWPKGRRPIGFSILRKPPGGIKRARTTFPTSSKANATTTRTKTPTANNKSSGTITTTTTSGRKTVTRERAAVDETNDQDTQAAIILAHKLASTFVPSNSENANNNASTAVQKQQERKSPFPTTTLPLKKSSHENTPSSNKSPSLETTTSPTIVVPFCRACRNPGATGRAHHALCPKHPQFDNSGAMEKLQLICRGIEMNCPACQHHYRHGRAPSTEMSHVSKCPRRKQPLRQNGQVLGMVDPVLAPPVITSTGRDDANKSDSLAVGTTEKKTTFNKKSEKKKTKSKRKNVEASQGSQSVTFASSADGQMQDATAATRDTFVSAAASSSGPRKKNRYNYDQESESDNDTKERTTLPSSQRSSLTRSKFTETGFDVPLVVDTKKKQSLDSKKNTKKLTQGAKSDAQIKPNWVPCENPWGSSGYEEGDVVLVTPSGGFSHHETIYRGSRFTVSPFGSDSDYGVTHRTPSEGFDVILLSRDPNAEHPWGFEFRRHEFGGACLVTSVDPLSPAASAVYRGNETEQSSGARLRIHDMILSMNGKSIGGMTELGISVELGVCGRELELVVARYRDSEGAAQQLAALEQSEWNSFDQAIGDKRRLDWFEMNTPDAKPSPRITMLEENEFSPVAFRGGSNLDSFEVLSSPNFGPTSFQNEPPAGPHEQFTPSRLSLASPAGSMTSRRTQRSQMSAAKRSRSVDSIVYDDDDEAWLGCVCGEVHEEPVRVFWIQCDDCRSWYNVAPACVGFKEFEASSVGTWICRACGESVADDQASISNRSRPSSLRRTCVARGSFGKRLSTLARAIPINLVSSFGTPGSVISRRSTSSQVILEDRKRRKTNDGCFLPLRSPRRKEDGTYARPCGRAPPGMEWDNIRGIYTPRSKAKASSMPVPSKIVIAPRPTALPGEKKLDSTCETVQKDDSICKTAKQSPVVTLPTASSKADRRTDDGCFVPLRTPTKKSDGTFARPCGRAPPGMMWDHVRGLYVPKAKLSVATPSFQGNMDSAVEASVRKLPESSTTEQCRNTTLDKSPTESEPSPLTRKESTYSAEPAAISVPAVASKTCCRTEDGCFVPLRAPTKKTDGTFARPCGRAPPGMTWDPVRGLYVPKSKDTVATASSQSNAQTSPKTSGCEENPSPETLELPSQDVTSNKKQPITPVVTAPTSSNSGQRRRRASRQERDADIKKRTTEDGCLIPKTAPTRKADGTFARPSGRCPPGKVFCPHRGLYVPKSMPKSKPTTAAPTVEPQSSGPKLTIDASKIKLTVVGSGMTDTVIAPSDASLHTSVDASKIKLTVVGAGMTDVIISPNETSLHMSVPEQASLKEKYMEASKEEEAKILPVGTLVSVAERVWIGCNKSGGIGTIIDYKHGVKGTVVYDVKYSLGGRERGIDSQWVTAHDFSKRPTVMRSN